MLFREPSDLIFTFWKNLQADKPRRLSRAICGWRIAPALISSLSDLYYTFISAVLARKTRITHGVSRSAVLILLRFFITNLVKFALPFDPYYWVMTTLPLKTVVFLRSNVLKKISTFICNSQRLILPILPL